MGERRGLVLLAWAGALSIVGTLPAQVVLNEVLARNALSSFDEDGDSGDWVELHNLGAAEVALKGNALTDDPELALKWVFPEVKLPPGGFLRVWLSGKDRFVLPPPNLAGSADGYAFEPDLIAPGEEWRYLVADPAQPGPPAGWNTIGFDDAGWATGRAGFGYGDDDDLTELPPGTTAVFIRRRFRVEDPARVATLVLQVDYDDGFVAYLNGTRVAAQNFGAGDPAFSSVAVGSREAGTPQRWSLIPFRSRLVAGDNVLALVGLNSSAGSSDLSLAPALGTIPLVVHAGFELRGEGEYLALTTPRGEPLDEVHVPVQTPDHSYGRSPDGTGPWRYLLTPTPEAPNRTRSSPTPFAGEVTFDPPAGKYPRALVVSMAAEPGDLVEIRYTTDGSGPTPASALYQGPIPVTRNTVFRAAGFIGLERSTRALSRSYFVGGALALPILSISMEPADFEKVHNDAGASGRASERPGYLEVFTEEGTLGAATGFGLRLHGGAGRGGDLNTKKAYKCYFRGLYGDPRLVYPIIPDTEVTDFDKLVLRSGFNDAFRTNGNAAYIRDQLIRELHQDMGAWVAHGSWCNLFVNMRFRGLYNVVERMDEEFLESYTGTEAWDVIKTGNDVLAGENGEWEGLHAFARDNDLGQDALFDKAAAMVDLENFTSYMVLNTWAQNQDWPHNNWYAARRQGPEGQWIFLSWDAEFGIGLIPGGYSADSFQFTLNQGGYLRDLFAAFLGNAAYREYFAQEVDRHLFHALRPANVLTRIDRLRTLIAPDIPEEAQLTGNTLAQWTSNVNACRVFAQNRGNIYRNLVLGSAAYAFPQPPRVLACDPRRVVNSGGVVVRMRGARLRADTRLRVNGIAPPALKYVPSTLEGILDVTLPFDLALSGFPAIAVENPQTGERSEARDLLEVLPPVPEPQGIDPSRGDPRGGERVRITGDLFLPGVAVRFGELPAAGVDRPGGAATAIEAVTPPGRGEVEVRVVNLVQGKEVPAGTTLRFTYAPPPPRFRRGDANGDGTIDLSDGVRILGFLYLGTEALPCADSADANDSGDLDLSDGVFCLSFLFTGGDPPPAPHPACGEDPTPDGVDCAAGRC